MCTSLAALLAQLFDTFVQFSKFVLLSFFCLFCSYPMITVVQLFFQCVSSSPVTYQLVNVCLSQTKLFSSSLPYNYNI